MVDPYEYADRAIRANREARPVRIADQTVVRPVTPATATVHQLLRHVRARGVDGIPAPVDLDDETETLTFVDGASGAQGWFHQHTDHGLASAAHYLRRVHDATSGWTPPTDSAWGMPPVDGDDLVVCHGDPGPWNFVWRDGDAVGLIDWDHAHPAPRLDDIAWALRWFVPLRDDELAVTWHHFPAVPDRRHRIQVFLQAYGHLPDFDVVEQVTTRIQATSDLVRAQAEQGQEPQRTWVTAGALEWDAIEIAWIEEHRHLFA